MQLKAVDVRFGGVTALSQVDLLVPAGQRLALIGANGSGKSTLLRVLHGLIAPASGAVLRDTAMRQAMLFQRPHMLRASALANVALGLWIRGLPWKDAKAQALLALGRVGLTDVAQRGARGLSGGQQQRLALARAWSLKPDVLLLDEPTSSLDPHAKREVEALMAGLASGAGGRPLTKAVLDNPYGQLSPRSIEAGSYALRWPKERGSHALRGQTSGGVFGACPRASGRGSVTLS